MKEILKNFNNEHGLLNKKENDPSHNYLLLYYLFDSDHGVDLNNILHPNKNILLSHGIK